MVFLCHSNACRFFKTRDALRRVQARRNQRALYPVDFVSCTAWFRRVVLLATRFVVFLIRDLTEYAIPSLPMPLNACSVWWCLLAGKLHGENSRRKTPEVHASSPTPPLTSLP